MSESKNLKIVDVIAVPVRGGFFNDDQRAILQGAKKDGFTYIGEPITLGFKKIRQPAPAVSVILVLSDGQNALGDCAIVQYAGASGREPIFDPTEALVTIEQRIKPSLVGRTVERFKELAEEVDALDVTTAIRYGVTQAILDAVAKNYAITMAEVVRHEYSTGLPIERVPIHAQTGEERYLNVDKMILHEIDVIPHGLINNAHTLIGPNGDTFAEYVRWVRDRVLKLRINSHYNPVLQFDVYGTIGESFGNDVSECADYLQRLEKIATPFLLRIEHVIDGKSLDGHVSVSKQLRDILRSRESSVQISVDEWCNTLSDIRLFTEAKAADVIHVKTPDLGGVNNVIEALLLVKRAGLAAYCGGTCAETDQSAKVSAHIAMACGAVQILAKPGMGVDEGLMIVGNEMARVEALVQRNENQSMGRS